jgi:hypothetical protein
MANRRAMKLPFGLELAAIGSVHWCASIPLAVSALASVILGGISAYEYAAVGKNSKGTSFVALTNTLYIAAALQFLLLILLVVRGVVDLATRYFTFNFVQMLMVIHCYVPNLLITGLWAARIMVDATVDQMENIDRVRASDGHLKAAYALHTISMISSNIYSAYALSVIFANTAFFSSLKLEGAERNPKEFAYYGAPA